MFSAILNGVVVGRALAYSTLEAEYADSTAVILNEETGVSWPADPACYDAVHGTAEGAA